MSEKKVIATDLAPAAIGPYSQAVSAGGFLFLAGQIPLDPQSGEIVSGGVKEQAERVLQNIEAVLKEAGCRFEDIVKTTIFLQDLTDFSVVNEVYASYMQEPYPARSTFQVAGLPKGALVEIEVIAQQ
ncbi:MAG: RidA family protein [Verrucomicrobiota bacterium]